MVEVVGLYAQSFDPSCLEGDMLQVVTDNNDAAPFVSHYLNHRKTLVHGGSNEIQYNIVSQMILGIRAKRR